MKNTFGIIMTGDTDARLSDLTRVRSVSALPVCGRYRLIDFTLSGMVNSGIVNVGVTAQSNYRSLMDHLGSGKEWDLNRKSWGLRILPPYIRAGNEGYWGDIDILSGISDFLSHSTQEYVLLAHGDLIFNPDFNELEAAHLASGADITVLYRQCPCPDRGTLLKLDDTGRVTDIEMHSKASDAVVNASMGIYLLKKSLLCDAVSHCTSRGLHDFVMDVLVRNVQSLKIYGCPYNGYVGCIDSVNAYYRCNMDMLDSKIRRQLFLSKRFIFTKAKDTVPTVYGESAVVRNCLVADGCRIDGTAENCIIFRGVTVEKGAIIKNSIIMQNSIIEKNVHLEYSVLDKSVVIGQGKSIVGQSSFPVIIGKKIRV